MSSEPSNLDRQVGAVLLTLSVLALALWHTGRRLARGVKAAL